MPRTRNLRQQFQKELDYVQWSPFFHHWAMTNPKKRNLKIARKFNRWSMRKQPRFSSQCSKQKNRFRIKLLEKRETVNIVSMIV